MITLRTRRLALTVATVVLGAAALAAPAAAPAAQVATVIDGFNARQLNNQQQIYGFTNTNYGEGHQPPALWHNGKLAPLPGPGAFNLAVDASLGENGVVVGSGYDYSDLTQPRKLGTVRTSPSGWGTLSYIASEYHFTTTVLDSGKVAWSVDGKIHHDGGTVFTLPTDSNGYSKHYPKLAADGSFVLQAASSLVSGLWYASPSAQPISLDDTGALGSVEVGSGGHAVSVKSNAEQGGATVTRYRFNAKSGTVAKTTYQLPIGGFAVISGKGTIVVGAGTKYYRIALDKQPEDISASLGAAATDGMSVRDINEWGDMIFAARAPRDAGGIFNSTSILLAGPRSALTGQIQSSSVASGRSGAKLGGKTVTVTGGAADLTAKTNAAGRFSVPVPAGAGYTIVAPKGACVVTGNGCHASTPLAPIPANGKPIKLEKVQAPAVAAFTAKKGALLKANKQGKIAFNVRCRAKAACNATVTLRRGRVVLGTGRTTIAKGRTKAVLVTLNAAGRRATNGGKRVPIGATLTTRVGKATSSLALSVRVAR